MADLANAQNTISILKKYNFHFQKKFGQNFLIDSHVLNKIGQINITLLVCFFIFKKGIVTVLK